jgi:hypothetical protein
MEILVFTQGWGIQILNSKIATFSGTHRVLEIQQERFIHMII